MGIEEAFGQKDGGQKNGRRIFLPAHVSAPAIHPQ